MDIIQIVVQAGSVGVAIYVLYVAYKLASNHLHDISGAMNRVEVAITKLTSLIEEHLNNDKK